MVPRLYDSYVTPWRWGVFMKDLTECIVTEELGGNFYLEAVIPATSKAYEHLNIGSIIEAKCRTQAITAGTVSPFVSSDIQFFRVYHIGRPINGKVTIKAEHEARYTAKNTLILPGEAATAFTDMPMIQPRTDRTLDMPVYFYPATNFFPARKTPLNLIDYMQGTEGSIVDNHHSCDYLYDVKHPRPESGQMPKAEINILCVPNMGNASRYEVRYGVNMSDFLHEIDDASQICGVFPYYYDTQSGTYVAPANAVFEGLSFTGRVVPVDFTQDYSESETTPTAEQLTAKAETYLARLDNKAPKINIKVNFVPVYAAAGRGQTIPDEVRAWLDTATLCLGDTISVIHDRLGITASARIISTKYDVLKDRVTEMEVGDARPSLPKTLAKIMKITGVYK